MKKITVIITIIITIIIILILISNYKFKLTNVVVIEKIIYINQTPLFLASGTLIITIRPPRNKYN